MIPMNDEQRFLQAILAAPDDDTPRLIYADWLEERGDVRAEFIRVQCELARLSPDEPQYPDLEERAEDLIDEHGETWAGKVKSIVTDYEFRRGFVERVSLGAKKFLTHGAKLFQMAPVRDMKLTRLGSSTITG